MVVVVVASVVGVVSTVFLAVVAAAVTAAGCGQPGGGTRNLLNGRYSRCHAFSSPWACRGRS